ncbi:MAG: ATP-binding protein, partial [Acidimicrobiia bacterium]
MPRSQILEKPRAIPGVSPVFIGRHREIAGLTAALEVADSGRMTAVAVAGESGVGKTRLVTHFARQATGGGATVLIGGCIELEDACPPYWPFIDAFRRLLARLEPEVADDLAGPFRRLLGRRDRARFFELVLEVAERLAAHSPAVLIIEDLQWADRSTRDLLGFLLANTIDDRILVVGTYRDVGLRPDHPLLGLLGELRRRGARFMELAPFDGGELTQLVREILGAEPDPELLAAILSRSDGNPFFAEELLAAAHQGEPVGLTPSLRHIIHARAAGLSGSAREVARVVAAGTGPVDQALLEAVAGLGAGLLDALRECVHSGVLVVDASGRFCFRHSLVREVVYGDLLPGEAARIHAAYG